MKRNVGFVSTRFAGTDGVTLESSKWAEVLRQKGHECYWFAGELDRNPGKSRLVQKAHFNDPVNAWINEQAFGREGRLPSSAQKTVSRYKDFLKEELYSFINQYSIDMLIAQNCLTIPIQIPLGLALTEVIGETGMETIAHHHDFYWERERFLKNTVQGYLEWAFPPDLPNIRHVVINSDARDELYSRKSIDSIIVPNVLDFDHPPDVDERKAGDFLQELGLDENDRVFLQPTRVVERKGIEYAIDLIRGLGDPHAVLVISHKAGDEGFSYKDRIAKYARMRGVRLKFYEGDIADPIYSDGDYLRKEGFNLWDIYPGAEFVTFPSVYEGFGNAFLEAIYFKKPVLVNRYKVFRKDIEPKGFNVIKIENSLTPNTVEQVRAATGSREMKDDIAGKNYEVAKNNYSYRVLHDAFDRLMQ